MAMAASGARREHWAGHCKCTCGHPREKGEEHWSSEECWNLVGTVSAIRGGDERERLMIGACIVGRNDGTFGNTFCCRGDVARGAGGSTDCGDSTVCCRGGVAGGAGGSTGCGDGNAKGLSRGDAGDSIFCWGDVARGIWSGEETMNLAGAVAAIRRGHERERSTTGVCHARNVPRDDAGDSAV